MKENLPSPDINFDNIGYVTDKLKVLSNPDRLKILCVLSHTELNVLEIEEKTDIYQPTLSQQLTVLRQAGMVTTRRAGKQIYYKMIDPKLLKIMHTLYMLYCNNESNTSH